MVKIKHNWKKLIALVALVCMLFPNTVLASEQTSTYTTYTFNADGNAVNSPDAYQFVEEYDGETLGVGSLNKPSDLYIDSQKQIYIVDKGNNRIVVLNPDFTVKTTVGPFEATLSGDLITDNFNNLSSVYVTEKGHMYVADTDNYRVVEFDENLKFVRQIGCPNSKILGDDYVFAPVSVVVDSSDRIYLMVQNENQGIVELEADGSFIGYYGAQKVEQSIFDWFKSLFMTKEQKSRIARIIPRTYNSMTIDDNDFVWLTSNSLTIYQRMNYMKSKSSKDAPIKRLNPSGTDVLARQGEYAPGGDLLEVSSLVDVAIKDNGVYSLLDNTRNRVFTYDEGGNLLYAFGGSGTQDGCITLAAAVSYFGDDLVVLDAGDGVIVRYGMTDYARNIQSAILADEEKDFEKSINYWEKVLEDNHNLGLAYKSMGENYLRLGEYSTAMEYYKNASETDGYSKAFQYVRAELVKGNFFIIIGAFLLLLVLWLLFKSWVNKENKKMYAVGTKQSLKSELLYAFRAIYHPFDGFWEIKTQKRGTVRAASIILFMVILTFCYKEVGTGYLFRTVPIEQVDIPVVILKVLIPLVLWCLASWGLTTLFDGKGSIKDIYIMSCYSMFPLIFTNIITTVMSNGMTLAEGDFISFISTIGFVWMVGLMFVGSMVVQDYRFNKNLGMIVASIVGMAVVLFLALLFVTVGQKMVDFFIALYEEITFRL